MRLLVVGAWQSDYFWRYIDAFAPRAFSFLLHTAFIWVYGAAAYALPAWILSICALLLSIIPDPHSYILVRRKGKSARRLLALTTPWILVKAALVFLLSFIAAALFATEELSSPHSESWSALILAVTLLASVEATWSVLGTAAIAIGNLRTIAIVGLVSRLIGIVVLVLCWLLWEPPLVAAVLLAATPILVAETMLMPASWRSRRLMRFMRFATRRYAIWSQGIGLTTSLVVQAPILILGASGLASNVTLGQFSYFTRVSLALMQPILVLQSFVIRAFAESKGSMTPSLSRLRKFFRIYAGIFALLLGLGIVGAYVCGAHGSEAFWLSLCVGSGFGVSIWYRFELCKVLATYSVRALLIRAYAPIPLVGIAIGAALVSLAGVVGVGLAALLVWLALSLSWMWIKDSG